MSSAGKFAAVKPHLSYGILTEAVVEEICDRRLLTADLMSRVSEPETAWAAKMVRYTVQSIRAELMELVE